MSDNHIETVVEPLHAPSDKRYGEFRDPKTEGMRLRTFKNEPQLDHGDDDDDKSIKQEMRESDYKTRQSLYVIVAWVICMGTGIVLGQPKETFFQWGPNDDAVFAGIIVNTWAKYIGIVVFAVISQCCESYVNSNLVPWVTNVVQDHKTEVIHMTWMQVMSIRLIHLCFEWMSSIAEILFLFTMQLQFFVFLMIGDMTVKMWRTSVYIRGKCIHSSHTNPEVAEDFIQGVDDNFIIG